MGGSPQYAVVWDACNMHKFENRTHLQRLANLVVWPNLPGAYKNLLMLNEHKAGKLHDVVGTYAHKPILHVVVFFIRQSTTYPNP